VLTRGLTEVVIMCSQFPVFCSEDTAAPVPMRNRESSRRLACGVSKQTGVGDEPNELRNWAITAVDGQYSALPHCGRCNLQCSVSGNHLAVGAKLDPTGRERPDICCVRTQREALGTSTTRGTSCSSPADRALGSRSATSHCTSSRQECSSLNAFHGFSLSWYVRQVTRTRG